MFSTGFVWESLILVRPVIHKFKLKGKKGALAVITEMWGCTRPSDETEATLFLLCFGLEVHTTKVVKIFGIEASSGKSRITCFLPNYALNMVWCNTLFSDLFIDQLSWELILDYNFLLKSIWTCSSFWRAYSMWHFSLSSYRTSESPFWCLCFAAEGRIVMSRPIPCKLVTSWRWNFKMVLNEEFFTRKSQILNENHGIMMVPSDRKLCFFNREMLGIFHNVECN